MEKKRILIISIIIIVIVILILLLFKSCGTKDAANTEEYNAFINANIELNCLLQASPDLQTKQENLDISLTQIYKKHGLPTEDNDAMLQILQKYEDNKEVTDVIKEGSTKCN